MIDDVSAKAFEKSGGLPALVKWIKESARNRAAFYSWYIPSRLRQPMVTNNVNVAIADHDGEGARRKLFDAIMRDKESQHLEHGAVFVNGDRLLTDARMTAGGAVIIDGVSYIRTDAQPSAAVLRPATDATPSPTAVPPSATAAQRPRPVVQSFVPGQAAGFALDGSDDKRSTTEKFLSSRWYGDRPP